MSDFVIAAEGPGFLPDRRYFVLQDDDRTVRQFPVACEADFHEWKRQTYGRYRVDNTVICKKPWVVVATIFGGHDDEPHGNRPLPWITSVWGGPLNGRHRRYATVGEAKRGHWRVVDLVRKAMKERPPA